MQTTSRKRAVVIVSLLLMAVASYWYWSPLVALRQMQVSAKKMDGEAFNQHVDYPRLRDSVKTSILGQQEGTSQSNDPSAGFGAAVAGLLVGGVVDSIVQPQVVMRMMQHGRFRMQEKDEPKSPEADAQADQKDWSSQREGMNTFIAFVGNKDQSDEQRLGLVLERSGFATWRLVGLRVPDTMRGRD